MTKNPQKIYNLKLDFKRQIKFVLRIFGYFSTMKIRFYIWCKNRYPLSKLCFMVIEAGKILGYPKSMKF